MVIHFDKRIFQIRWKNTQVFIVRNNDKGRDFLKSWCFFFHPFFFLGAAVKICVFVGRQPKATGSFCERRFVRSQPKGWIAVKDVGILRLLEVRNAKNNPGGLGFIGD